MSVRHSLHIVRSGRIVGGRLPPRHRECPVSILRPRQTVQLPRRLVLRRLLPCAAAGTSALSFAASPQSPYQHPPHTAMRRPMFWPSRSQLPGRTGMCNTTERGAGRGGGAKVRTWVDLQLAAVLGEAPHLWGRPSASAAAASVLAAIDRNTCKRIVDHEFSGREIHPPGRRYVNCSCHSRQKVVLALSLSLFVVSSLSPSLSLSLLSLSLPLSSLSLSLSSPLSFSLSLSLSLSPSCTPAQTLRALFRSSMTILQ